jgi:hypothetical protein
MFQMVVTSGEDVDRCLRKHNYDILIDLAKSCHDDEYGKAVLNRLMKDLMNTKVGELLRELLRKGATLETKAKPGPKPGVKRKSSPNPTSPARKTKDVAEAEPEKHSAPSNTNKPVSALATAAVENDEEAHAFDSPRTKKKRG